MFVSQAVIELCKFEGSQTKFANKTGISRSTVSNIRSKGEGQGVNLKNIMSIINAYEDLNVRWLMTGEGEMWIEDLTPGGENPHIIDEEEEELKAKGKKIEMLEELLENRDELLKLTKQRVVVLENGMKRMDPEGAKEYGVE